MHTAVIGLQFGDEGKGKLVDKLAEQHAIVVRYSGGSNAGHTVIVGDEEYKLHLIPCGVIHAKPSIIGNGVVVNFDRLEEEIEMLAGKGITLTPEQLLISERAHVVTPYHLLRDFLKEIKRQMGTTLQGIGPTYEDKIARQGLTTGVLATATDNELTEIVQRLEKEKQQRLKSNDISKRQIIDALENRKKMTAGLREYINLAEIDTKKVLDRLKQHRDKFAPFITNTAEYLEQRLKQPILFESAQGALLDIDHGTYPFVTASNPTIGGIFTGTGIYCDIPNRIGVLKAYTTKVGSGPFPTKITGPFEELIRKNGHEIGVTTGRNRDIGWLDIPALQHAIRTNGINQLVITKLDTLDFTKDPREEPIIKVCVAYEINGHQTTTFPATQTELEKAKPVYVECERWTGTANARNWDELPEQAQAYIKFIQTQLKVPIKYVSTGPEREQILMVR